jgi:predicted kinase
LRNEIKKSGSIILLRGLPGAGKSTLASVLSEKGKYPVLAIDDYFIDKVTGEYKFNHQDNHLAYKQCEQLTRECFERGDEKIFVDNTFTLEWELEPYFKMASEYNYTLFVVTVENRHGNTNLHGTSEEQLKRMAAKYKVVLHPFDS